MSLRTIFKIFAILVIAGAAAFATLPASQKAAVKDVPYIGAYLAESKLTTSKVNLGLDLQGGTHLDYRVVTAGIREADIPAVVTGVRQVIERRVDKLGVAEPNIYEARVGGEPHIVVELAGIKDIEQAKAIVGKTIQLEFKEQKTTTDPNEAAAIAQKAAAFLAAAKADPAKFEDTFSNYEAKPAIALEKDTEWQWLGDLSGDFATAAKTLTIGQVFPTLIQPGAGEYFVNAAGSVAQRQGYYVAQLLEKEAQATRTIEHKESRSVSHILIAFKGADKAPETVTRTEDEAKKHAEELLAQAKAGEDFAALAKANSDDPGSKDKGGNYPTVEKGQMVPAFEDAAFGLAQPGMVDHIVRTSFGYHVIKVDSITPASTETKKDDRVKFSKAFFSTTPDGWQATGLTGQHFRRADVGFDQTSLRPIVNIHFTQAAVAESTVDWQQLAYYLLATIAGVIAATYGLGLLVAEGRVATFRRDLVITLVALVVGAAAIAGAMHLDRLADAKKVAEEKPTVSDTQAVGETDKAGVDLFAEITKRNVGKPLAIFLDGESIIDGNPDMPGRQDYAPTVQTEITSGQAVISGLRTPEEANQLAQNLNTGAIPAPVKLVGQYTIGATLGADALDKSLTAGLIGLVVVMVFMILFYRLPGVIAAIALAIYTVLTIAAIQLGGIVMTLAGVAGVVLSVGMAVDANILIFERLKEELRLGKPLNVALHDGFARAWTSIRDSNASSLITCAILFWFGSSVIKGFALTLALGIVISLFTAITVTRTLLSLFVNRHFAKWGCLFGVSQK